MDTSTDGSDHGRKRAAEDDRPSDIDKKKPRPDLSAVSDTFVTLKYDDGSRLVHKDLLCQESPVFESALNGTFEEGVNQCFKIDATEDTFVDFFHWLYSDRLPDAETHAESDEESCHYIAARINLYILAQKYGVSKLQESCLEKLWRTVNDLPKLNLWPENVLEITTRLPESDTLYRIIVHTTAQRMSEGLWKDRKPSRDAQDSMPGAFWMAVAREMAKQRTAGFKPLPDIAAFINDPSLGRPVRY